MSTTTKKLAPKGVRYTDAQKKEVVNFVNEYNVANSRGGQSKAAEKFNISPLTVAAWLKSSAAPKAKANKKAKAVKSAKAPKAAEAPKTTKSPKAAKAGKGRVGTRYTDEQKKEVVDFAVNYNAANGRGGQSKAAAKFNISPLTVMAWLKSAGVKGASKKAAKATKLVKTTKAAKPAKAAKTVVSSGMNAKLSSLLELSNKISKTEAELASLKSKFNSIKASL
jgi:hypothetical protein